MTNTSASAIHCNVGALGQFCFHQPEQVADDFDVGQLLGESQLEILLDPASPSRRHPPSRGPSFRVSLDRRVRPDIFRPSLLRAGSRASFEASPWPTFVAIPDGWSQKGVLRLAGLRDQRRPRFSQAKASKQRVVACGQREISTEIVRSGCRSLFLGAVPRFTSKIFDRAYWTHFLGTRVLE